MAVTRTDSPEPGEEWPRYTNVTLTSDKQREKFGGYANAEIQIATEDTHSYLNIYLRASGKPEGYLCVPAELAVALYRELDRVYRNYVEEEQ